MGEYYQILLYLERGFHPLMPRPPFCGVWMSSKSCRTQEKNIFHPNFFCLAWMMSCARSALVKFVMHVVVYK
jgi:hypothetical protein